MCEGPSHTLLERRLEDLAPPSLQDLVKVLRAMPIQARVEVCVIPRRGVDGELAVRTPPEYAKADKHRASGIRLESA